MKRCPECAEQVQDAAKVCRFCGHRFAELPPAEPKSKRGPIAALVLAGVVLAVAMCSADPAPEIAAADPEASARKAECDRAIAAATAQGIITARPKPDRVDVEDSVWAQTPASAKQGLAATVACSAYGGRKISDLSMGESAVVYGHRSGKRLAMATSVGVTLE